MSYPGQPGKRPKPYISPLNRRARPAISARQLCLSRGARYSTESAARESLAYLERTKVNPGALTVFLCESCDGFHLGTTFGPNPRSARREKKLMPPARRRRAVVPNEDHQS